MRARILMWAAALVVLFVAAAPAADVTGKWMGQAPGRGGQMNETTFTFKAAGEKLTGTMTGPQGPIEISGGKVNGDEISFTVTLSFNGNEIKLLFTGKVSGDEIKFTRQREGAGQTQEFTVKRATT